MKTRRTTLHFHHRNAFAAFAALAVLCSASFAKEPGATGAAAEAALRAAEIKRFEANVNADAKVLGELLDDGLEYVHSNGELDTKKSFIESLTSGTRDYASSAPRIETVRIHGDVAIIRGTAKVTVIDKGTSRDLHIGYTDVWLWKDGRWQMTAWRSARLPDSPVK
jgi:hypothetical protein